LESQGKSKSVRAAPAIIRTEAGQIWLPYPDDHTMPWVGPLDEELYSFTGKEGGVDDQTDCIGYAVMAIDQLGYGPQSEDAWPCGVGRRPGPFQYW